MKPLTLVAALADNRVIGRDNALIWRLKSDMRRFRSLTIGKPMIMGRKTYQSIGKPLPQRETIVLTRDKTFKAAGIHVAHHWDDALRLARQLANMLQSPDIIIAGGAEIYALALPDAQKLCLTFVHAEPEGDALFPLYNQALFHETFREPHEADIDNEHAFTFVDYER
jgi:dihydrofolate reductase